MYSILYSALNQAVKNQMLIRNVCSAVQSPGRSKTKSTPWTQEQTLAFLTSIKETRIYPVFITEWGTGARLLSFSAAAPSCSEAMSMNKHT